VTLGAGLVLSGCGDDDTATTPAPAPPPPPPPAPEPEPEPEPEPQAPATPTGFHVDTTQTSLTWHWNAVEGAIGYAVQVSTDEMFDDTDTITPTAETSFTVADLPPQTTLYGRVAAAAGTLEAPLLSAWTTHVTGTTDMPPPPPPPAPDPVMVTFSLSDDADSPHFLVADDDDDEETAMAWVNPEIMVNSNTDAIITPMFVEDSNGAPLYAGSNMPFTYLGAEDNWELSQSDVLSDGATFRVQRAVLGANQEMEPSGDVMYITCGPFECVEGEDAPELSIANSAVCTMWNPMVDIQVGKVDNDVIPPEDGTTEDGAYATGVDINDGVDLGIVTTSSLEMNVKHVFSGVPGGTNISATVKAAKGSDRTLAMSAVASITVDADVDVTGTAATGDAPFGINEEAVCEDTANGMGRYDGGDFTDKPAGCFRLRGPGAGRTDNDPSKGANYLRGWTIELSPVGGDVSWGRVDWDDDPFEDLTCGDADPIVVADHVDICDMFKTEVANATGKGWKPTVVFRSETAGFTETTPPTGDQVVMWKADASRASGYTQMFKTIWFDDNLDGKILRDTKTRPAQGDGTVAGDKFNDLYNHNSRDANIEQIWKSLLDSNDDLTAGDLGKVDLVSSKDDRSTADDERTILVESCPSGTSWAPRDGYGTDGTGTSRVSGNLDGTGCKTSAQRRDRLAGVARTRSSATAAHPDGNADNYETGGPTDGGTAGAVSEYSTTAANNGANRMVMENADDFYKCSEDDGGDDPGEGSDAPNSICDFKDIVFEGTIMFADGTFGCTDEQDITVTCEWDADGGMAQGRNALPMDFTAGGENDNKDFFLKCRAS